MSQLKINIVADAKSAIENLGKTRRHATNLEKGFNKLSKSANTLGTTLDKTVAIPLIALGTGLTLASKKAIDFSKSMAEVKTLLPGITNDGFAGLKKEVLDLGVEMGKLPDEVVPALYQAISAGVPKDNVIDFLRTASKASIAGVSDLTSSVDGLTSVVNAYGSDVITVQEASDLMFSSVRLGKTTFSELSASLSNVIPVASSTGVSFADVSAAISTITSQGTPTAEATVQIRQALSELNKETSSVSVLFKELTGKTFRDFIKQGGNLNDVMQILSKHADDSDTSISNLFGNIRAGQAALQLTGKASQKFADDLKAMEDSAGSTDTAFQTMAEDVSHQMDVIKADLNKMIIKLGQDVLPIVKDDLVPLFKDSLAPTLKTTAEAVGNLLKWFNGLDDGSKKAVAALGLIAISSGTVLKTASGLITGFKNIRIAMLALNSVSFGPLLGTLGLLVGTFKMLDHYSEELFDNQLDHKTMKLEATYNTVQNYVNRVGELTDSQIKNFAKHHKVTEDVIKQMAAGTYKIEKAEDKAKDTAFDLSGAIKESQKELENLNNEIEINTEETDKNKDSNENKSKEVIDWEKKAIEARMQNYESIDFYRKQQEQQYLEDVQKFQEKNKWLTDIGTNTLTQFGNTIGENLILQGDMWGALSSIAVNAVADIIQALGNRAFVESAVELAEGFAHLSNPLTAYLAPLDFKASAKWAGVGTLASIAAGAVRAIPELAEGGLATKATTAVIGEGIYDEAVIPLSDEVFNRLAEGITRTENYNKNNINLNFYFSSQFDVSNNAAKRKAVRELQPMIISGLRKAGAIK